MKAGHKKALILTVKLAVAGGLLWFALQKVHWGDYTEEVRDASGQVRQVERPGLRSALAQADAALLAGALACFATAIFIVATRWWYLLRVLRIRIGLWEAIRLSFLGYFFSFLVPGVVSGDLIKAWYVFKHTQRKGAAVVSIFVDRVVGLLMFALLSAAVLAGLWAAGEWDDRFDMPALAVAILLAALAVGSAAMLYPPTRRLFGRALAFRRLKDHLDMAGKAVELYRRRFSSLVGAAGLTFCSQVITILGILLIGRSLGLASRWYEYFLYVPLIYIIAAVPVSPGGWGVMEYFFVHFFADGAVTNSEAFALGLLAHLGPMICSLPGLVVALRGAKLPKTAQMQAELE